MTLSHQTLWWPPCIPLRPSKFDVFASMMSLVLIPTRSASTATGKIHSHFKIYSHILPSSQFSINFTLQTHLSCKHFNISIQTLLHTFIPRTLLTLSLSKPTMSPFSLVSKRSHPFSRTWYFTITSLITTLSGYLTLTYPLLSSISASV